MRVNSGFVMRDVAGQTVIVATGEASKGFRGMIKVNAAGKVIWGALSEGLDEAAVVERVLDRFAVDRATAQADVAAFIADMRRHGFLSE